MPLTLSRPLLIYWTLSNAEAYICRSPNIDPVHFWLGALKFVDDKILNVFLDKKMPEENWKEIASESNRLLAYLEKTREEAETLRRTLRRSLLGDDTPAPIPDDGAPYLHRSPASRRLFQNATELAGSRSCKALFPIHVVETLFDMKLVDMSDLKVS